jgi:hypothetical protein
MMTITSVLPLRVAVNDPGGLQEELEAAVGLAQSLALSQGACGVVVTRRSYTEFTVECSDQVPYGTTLEREQWN